MYLDLKSLQTNKNSLLWGVFGPLLYLLGGGGVLRSVEVSWSRVLRDLRMVNRGLGSLEIRESVLFRVWDV